MSTFGVILVPIFPAFGLNTGRYKVPDVIQEREWFRAFLTLIFKKDGLANTTWKIIEKKTKKTFVGFFSIWCHPRKGVIQSSPNTYFQKRWFLLANTRWKWPKSEKLLKKTKEKFSSHFFDMTSSKKGCGPGLS